MRVYRDLEQIILRKFDMAAERDVSTDDAMSDIDVSLLQLEVKMMNALKIKGSMPQFEYVATLVQTLPDKPPEVRMMFPETVKLANLLIVVPASSATAERSFSCLRRLKTWLNSTTTQARLNSVAILNRYHGQMEPDIARVLAEFVGLNDN